MSAEKRKEDCGFRVLEECLYYAGMVYQEGRSRTYFRTAFAAILLFYINNILVTGLYAIGDHPFADKTDAIQCFITAVHLAAKGLTLQYRQEEFKVLLQHLKEMWIEAKDIGQFEEYLLNIKRNTSNVIRNILLVMVCVVPFSIVIISIKNIFLETGKRKTIYLLYDPFPEEWYYTICTYQAFEMYTASMMFAFAYAILYSVCLQASGQMGLLSLMLKSDQLEVKDCVIFHQKLIKLIHDINNFFSANLLFEAVLWAFQISIRTYHALHTITRDPLEFLIVMAFLTVLFLSPCIVCLAGQQLRLQSEKIYESAYQNKWYTMDTEGRRVLLLLMNQASKPLRLHYRNLIDFNMERLSLVFQATYSYITILVNADV